MFFRQIYDPKLSQYAYLIGCQATGEMIVVDPMRDVDTYFDIAAAEGLRIVATAETHIHADFLSGARELAARGGITVHVSGAGGPDWQSMWVDEYPHQRLGDGDHFMVGNIRFDVMHTPGHTPEHVVYLVTDTPAGTNQAMGMISGDFVFVGDVGRPDLLETAAGQAGSMVPSARALFDSLVRFKDLPAPMQLWPGHGAGSACGKALGAVPMSTIGYELMANQSIRAAVGRDAFVAHILDGQPEPPLYFARMKRQNREGPPVLESLPKPRLVRQAKFTELAGATGVAVLDTRPWDQYSAAHLPGALFAPLNRQFNTLAGSYVPEGMAIYLIIEERRLEEAVADLIHVGLDNIVGYSTPQMFGDHVAEKGSVATVPEVSAELLGDVLDGNAFLLDVRGAAELRDSGQIPGAHNIAHTRLLDRIAEVPRERQVLVLCQSGGRSAYACGLLDRLGFRATNVVGGFDAWVASGGTVERVGV